MMISIHQLVVILLLAELASQIQLEAVKPESLRSRDKSTERLVFIKICKLKPIRYSTCLPAQATNFRSCRAKYPQYLVRS